MVFKQKVNCIHTGHRPGMRMHVHARACIIINSSLHIFASICDTWQQSEIPIPGPLSCRCVYSVAWVNELAAKVSRIVSYLALPYRPAF